MAAAARCGAGTVRAMDAVTFAERIVEHVPTGWEHVAEVARAGTAAKIAAVRSGEQTTATLDVRSAARVAAEVANPAAATAGDDRVTVRAALGETATKRRSPTAALFDGTAEQVRAALSERSSTTPAMVEAYLASSPEVRAAAADRMLIIGDIDAIAAVMSERAATLGPGGAAAWFGPLLDALRSDVDQHRPRLVQFAGDAGRQLARLAPGAATALAVWLDTYALDAKITSEHVARLSASFAGVAEEAGGGLAAIASTLGVTFAGPVELGAAALAHSTSSLRFRSAIASGVPWSAMRERYAAEHRGGSGGAAAEALSYATEHQPRTNPFIVELTAAEFAGARTADAYMDHVTQSRIAQLEGVLDDTSLLRVAALTGNHMGSQWSVQAAYNALAKLLSTRSVEAVAAVADNDERVDAHIRSTVIAAVNQRIALHPAVWRHAVARLHTGEFAELAADHPVAAQHLAETLSAHIEAVAAGSDVRRAELWAATCTLAPTMAAPAAQVVETAAATIGA